MKKSILYIIIVILLMIIAVGGTYIFMQGQIGDKNNSSPSENGTTEESGDVGESKKDNDVSKSGITLVSTKEEGNNIIETFNANLNGKNTVITVKFEYRTQNIDGDFPIEYVEGSINGSRVYYHAVEEVKGKSQKSIILNKDYINNEFNKNNFIIIKGRDNKDYLSVVSHTTNIADSDIGPNDNLYVFDDNMNQIKTEETTAADCEENAFTVYSRSSGIKVEGNPWYKNAFNINLSKKTPGWDSIRVKIENDKIYYLAQVFSGGDPSIGTLEEREYTINGGKLSYKTINSYKIIDGAGGAC